MSILNRALRKSRTNADHCAPFIVPQLLEPNSVAKQTSLINQQRDNDTAGLQGGESVERSILLKHLHRNRLVAAEYCNPIADTYRILRARVLKQMVSQGLRSLGICSAIDGEGKTITAANLAISLSLDTRYSTILIDLDLKNPSVQTLFSFEADFGLVDYLGGGGMNLQDCIIQTDIEHLRLLPAGRRCLNSSELISSRLMTDLLKQLRKQNDQHIIICDLPPILVSDDALVALSQIDACLLIVREGRTKVQDIRRCIDLISESHLIGTVLNDSNDHFNIAKYY